MTMDEHRIDQQRRALLAAAAAERAMAIIDLCASTRSRALARKILDEIWHAAELGEARGARELVRRIERIPEARITDSNRRTFFAQEALESLAVAASSIAEWDAGNPEDYRSVAAGIFSAYDGPGEGDPPQIIDPRNPPPPGPVEFGERAQQERDIEVASSTGVVTEMAEALRADARRYAEAIVPQIERVIRSYR